MCIMTILKLNNNISLWISHNYCRYRFKARGKYISMSTVRQRVLVSLAAPSDRKWRRPEVVDLKYYSRLEWHRSAGDWCTFKRTFNKSSLLS